LERERQTIRRETVVADRPGRTHDEIDEVLEGQGAGLLRRALRSAGSDAAKYVPVRLVPALTSLITVPVFTAAIGTADYGAFYLISTAATLIAGVATGWVDHALIRFYWPAKQEGWLDRYVASVVWGAIVSVLVTAAIAGAAAALGLAPLPAAVGRLVPAGLAYFVFGTLTARLMQMPRAANRAGTFARFQVAGAVTTTVISVALVWWARMGAAGIFWGVAIGWALILPFTLRDAAREGSISPRAADAATTRTFLEYGLPLLPVSIASWALALIDRFVVEAFRGTAEVGLYSVTFALGDRLMALTMTPSLIEMYEKRGQALAEKVVSQFVRYYALATVPLLVGMWAAARPFLEVFTADRYWSASPVLGIVAGGTLLHGIAQIATTGLTLHKRTRIIMENTVASAVFKLVASIVVVPWFGYVGAAYSTLAAYGLLLALTWWRTRRYMRLDLPWSALARIAAAGVGMAAALWLATLSFVPGSGRWTALGFLAAEAIGGLAVYLVLCAAFGAVRRDEWAFVGELAARAGARLRGRGSRP
jgi:O-antigen/teichoic acid export membrane protein